MPIIDFHGKKAIQNYEPPFHLLEEDVNLSFQSKVPGNSRDNILIEGDNLLALKSLLPEYAGRIKCIYIDPPYNTNNKDWVYCDNIEITSKNDPAWQQVEKFLKAGNEVDYNDPSRHSKWLCMMYPRIKLLHQLLKDDGVIFISIDDNEVHHLRMIMDEVFGDMNLISELVWKNKKGGGNDSTYIAVEHEYILMYAKRKKSVEKLFSAYTEAYLKRYKEEDSEGRFYWDTFKRKSGKQYYAIKCPDGTILEKDQFGNKFSWLRSEKRFLSDLKKGDTKFLKTNDGWSVQFKQRLPKGKKPRSILDDWGTTSSGSEEIFDIFNAHLFENPKPSTLIAHLLDVITSDGDIILDSFAGSGTTGQAVSKLNIDLESDINRSYILIQLQEEIKEKRSNGDKNPAFEAGYKYVHEITRERIVRVSTGYKDSKGNEVEGLGGGFKYYKLGTPLFTKNKENIVSSTTWDQLAPYLFFTEFKKAIGDRKTMKKPFVGEDQKTGLYLIYKEPQINHIDEKFVDKIKGDKTKKKIVYADYVDVDDDVLKDAGIIFRQIPYDIFCI